VKEVIINTFYLKLQLLPATSQDSGEFMHLLARLPQRAEQAILISQGSVATRLRSGGIFNDHFIANFLENATVKEF